MIRWKNPKDFKKPATRPGAGICRHAGRDKVGVSALSRSTASACVWPRIRFRSHGTTSCSPLARVGGASRVRRDVAVLLLDGARMAARALVDVADGARDAAHACADRGLVFKGRVGCSRQRRSPAKASPPGAAPGAAHAATSQCGSSRIVTAAAHFCASAAEMAAAGRGTQQKYPHVPRVSSSSLRKRHRGALPRVRGDEQGVDDSVDVAGLQSRRHDVGHERHGAAAACKVAAVPDRVQHRLGSRPAPPRLPRPSPRCRPGARIFVKEDRYRPRPPFPAQLSGEPF
ncbi:hypothetical protein M885DRAFT_539727 [Pelagophyceae sp. CCMP2097]|nr:hypothetical protein M885DRAFT_539727 [Pelagophyceae sp. CCMP2097]|mmetsp:Transcript_28798/g.97067  ORF Transcript_28798/g.97067 Transcript_28798/m.97067 type:complete len:287 (+) Transcript_28798:153-1013(+)